jgi:CRP/FNR family transcriptional regulator, cyclic AMP receptor protein
VDAATREAIARSHLGGVPDDVRSELLAGARLASVPAGDVLHWEGDDTAHLELVVAGVVRVRVTAPDGRTMTIRYCRRGSLLGAMSLFRRRFTMPATADALIATRLLRFSPPVVRRAAAHPEVSRSLLLELSERAEGFLSEIPGGVFGTVRERVVRHLLDLAVGDGVLGELTVSASQQDIAEAAGTVREVVVRALRELRDDGLVRTERGRVVLLDVDRLVAEEMWNLSS